MEGHFRVPAIVLARTTIGQKALSTISPSATNSGKELGSVRLAYRSVTKRLTLIHVNGVGGFIDSFHDVTENGLLFRSRRCRAKVTAMSPCCTREKRRGEKVVEAFGSNARSFA